MRIFLDMDEVLADFTGGALRVHDATMQDVIDAMPRPGHWGLAEPLGLSLDEFWSPIEEEGEEFWLGLDPLPWAEELLTLVREATDDWYIVSDPMCRRSAPSGKIRWLKRYLGREFDRLILTRHKSVCAGRDAILVDDRESNIAEFKAAGGRGIVFPRYCNRLQYLEENPMPYVRLQLLSTVREIRHALAIP